MKRKAKQRKSNFSPINQTHNSFDCTSKSDGPRTRSSNEYQEHSKTGAIPPVLGSDRSFPARGRLSRSASDSDCAVFNSVAVRGSSRGRRSKTAAQPAVQSVLDSRSQSVSYDQTISLSDYKRFELSTSILQDYEQEDTGLCFAHLNLFYSAPDLVAMHDLSVSSTPSTFVESRHFTDKSDVNTLHNQRRLNKRELKALLKQTKKSRAVVDENVLATMEQLADRIKGNFWIFLCSTFAYITVAVNHFESFSIYPSSHYFTVVNKYLLIFFVLSYFISGGAVIDLYPLPPKPIRFASPPPYVFPTATPRTKLVSTRGRGGPSGSAALEAGYRPKLALSSTARSGVSTESSSVSSDLFTSHVQGFEHGEVQSYDKPSMSSPVTLISNPTTKLEHKEVYSNSEVDVASLHPTPPCCGEQSGSLGPVKYSPISTDQDPDLSLTADVDLVQEKTFENIQEPQCHFASHKRRGRKQTKHSSQIPTSAESVSLIANNKLETVGDMSTSSTPCTSEPSGSCTGTVLTSTGKRRRQSLHSPAVHLSESEAVSGRVDSDDWSGLHSPEEVISGLGNSPSGGPRRAIGSRSAALPPRKRYKAGVDTSTSVTLSSTHLIQDGSGDGPINSLSGPGIIGALVEQEEASRQNKAESSSALTSSASMLSSEPVKKRGRGRPSRRGALTGAAHPVPTLPTSPYTPPSDTVLSVDRPKREAAAIGFASLVAANLNNSTAQAGSTQSMDSPTRRTPASDMPLVISSPVVANMSHEGNRLAMPIRQAPRGRGRPPRPKTILNLSMTSGAVSSAATEVTSSTAPRKRSAEPPSPTQKVYKDEHSQASLCPDSAVVPPAKKIPRVAASRAGVRRRPSQSNENGIAATEIPTEVVSNLYFDDVCSFTFRGWFLILTCHPALSDNFLRLLSHFVQTVGQASNRSVGPTTGPSDAPMRGRKGRPRIHGRPLPHQSVENLVSSPVVKLPINPANVSALANLPGRATLFSGHSLKDPILLGTNPDAPCKGPLCDLFLRFLNEPDPFDPTCRLVAPIVYLPTPERNPEFYRFVISSYSSGSGFRIRFSDSLLRRIFTTSSMNPCQHQQKSAKNEEGAVFDVEFPSLCLASIARRLYDRTTLQAGVGDLTDWLHSPNGLTESELACVPLDATDTENCLPLLDAAIESLLTVWESFAGRRSWLGRRLSRLRTVYSTVRTECALSIANNYGLIVPPLKATAVLNLPYYKPLGPGTKKKEYPRSLSAAMAMDDLSSVFSLQETIVEGEHEFWSLASPDGNHQIRTDDYAFVNRIWLQFSQSPTSLTATKRADTKQAEQGFAAAKAQPIECAYDRLVIRIYRLWKDSSGESWLEGGLFLRPYDVVQIGDLPSEKTFAQSRLWHHREVIYDEASRLVLPLKAWHGRCVVLCPSAYRTGRPADLLSAEEATRFLVSDTVCSKGFVSDHGTVESSSLGHAFFVCDKLFERTPGSCAVGYRFDEISPGYLKVNMKPYCFLRKPDVPGLGRPNLQRQFTASQLLEIDRASSFVNNPLSNIQSNSITRTSRGDDITNATHSEQPKGAKLAKLVAWLERKRQQDAKITDNCSVNQCSVNLSASCTHSSTTAVPVVRPPNGRGRPPRGSRGRGRPPRTTAVVHLSAPPNDGSQNELMTQHDQPVCASESISAETLCASVNNDQNVETMTPTVEPREFVTTEVFTAVTHTSSTTESHPSCCSDSVATSVLPMDAENRNPVSSGYPSNDNKSENQKSSNKHTMTSDVNKLSALMDIHEETDHISDSRAHHSRCTSSNSPVVVRSSCSIITENKMGMIMTTPDTREKILERLTSRRKRITSRRRTASESKPPINPLPLVHDIPRFLSDSETTEPVFFMPDLSDKIVPPLMDHESSSPVPLVDDVTVDRKSLTPNSLSESTRPVCSVTSQNNSATPADCSVDIIDGIDTTADSCIGPASEQGLLVESVSTLSDINHEFSSLEASAENSVPVVDQIGNELAEKPQILVVSGRTHPESVTPLGAVAQSDSSLTTETGCESKAANQCLPDGGDKESGLESQPIQICRTEIYSVTDPCNEPTSNNASVCFVSVSASEDSSDPTSPQKPIVFGDEFVGIPTNHCCTEDRRGSETLLKLVVENSKSQFDETLVSTETVCESNVQPETLVSDSHLSPTRSRDLTSLLSPVSESTSDFADPSDTVQLTEKTSAPVDESQPDCEDPPEYDIMVDHDSTPILDEPGGHGRFDSESNSTGPNEFCAVSCMSETMNALFFTVSSNANRIESESHDRVSPVIPDSTAFSQRPSAGPRNTEENTSDSNHTSPYGPRKDCRSDSRHGCIHRDRPSSRHQSHKSDRHRHHHKHDRNRRDHSPTSSRHSSSSGGGNRHSRSQRSPTTFDGRRKGHSHDHISQHGSPSNSSRSSASSISHRYTHQPHHYRHHSRKESGRSREGDSSSADFDSGRSTSHDRNQLAGPRRP
ncbi:putative histone-lysine N-methyltransferase ASH1L [Fasciola gigantica]|uniref:Putative histone-lysine N-methyltransferase ASH1L n=1 Tax=Fasciola gigantica TaxID=46835 RepID=A0A504YBH5_FASGI|nr:putative histone-lysine N-methyltransferase ASH1L [Fasciola gigantica]